MPDLHLLVGPNGSGKTTFYEKVLAPVLHLPFVNADRLAKEHWPGDEEANGHDAARLAEKQRDALLTAGRSFVAETVFSHPSKLDLIARAKSLQYLVTLHVMIVPEDLTVRRTQLRVQQGGHAVPETKVRERYRRLWLNVERAVRLVDEATIYDNSSARSPYREVARLERGRSLYAPRWPKWSPVQFR